MRSFWLACMLVLAGALAAAGAADAQAPAPVFTLRIDGAIGPASAARLDRALERAARERAQLVVLQMDTPGGLDTAMRGMVKGILASPVPVARSAWPRRR